MAMPNKITRAKDPERVNKMKSMRKEGYTFQEIGKEFGVSKQDVHQILNNTKTRYVRNNRIRSQIVYKGVFEYFTANPEMNFTDFTRKIYCTNYRNNKQVVGLIRFLRGENVSLPLWVYKRICNVCDGTFEEVFERREEVDDE